MRVTVKNKSKVIAEIEAYTSAQKRNVKNALKKTAQRIERDAKENLTNNGSVKTGRLRSSITHVKVDDYLWQAGTNVKYGKYVEFGTSPHKITPRSKKALAFTKNGKKVVVKSVMHPGSKAKPFLLPAAEENRRRLVQDIKGM
jgi:HK97 gp10 family phage protein